MHSTGLTASLLATATFISSTIASPLLSTRATPAKRATDLGLAVYWGQGPSQNRLADFCQDTTIDVIPIGFVNVFPDDSGSNGYPGTNYGNACGGSYWIAPDGTFTQMFTTCDQIAADVKTCQDIGKKILVSLGGASDVTLNSSASAVDFADFLWGAYGPEQDTTQKLYPRPFGSTIVDGFDLDIESGGDSYYSDLVTELRARFATYTGKSFYISGAPQCVVPDAHLDSAITNSHFDYVFVQYYNTESCSAYSLFTEGTLDSSKDPSWGWVDWLEKNSLNKDVKLYVGLPASEAAASGSANYYLNLNEAKALITEYACTSTYSSVFGGVMVWEATYSENNQINGQSYAANIKDILNDITCGTTSTSTSTTSTTTTSTTSTTLTTTLTTTTTTTTTTATSSTTSTSTSTVAPSTTASSSTTTPTTSNTSTSSTTTSSTSTTTSSTASTTTSSTGASVTATVGSSSTTSASFSTTTTTSSTSTATEVPAGQALTVTVNMDSTKKNKRDTYYLGINDNSVAVLGSQADAATLVTGEDGTILYGAEFLGSSPTADDQAAFLTVSATQPVDYVWLIDASGALTLSERQFCVLSDLQIETVDAAGDNCDGTIVTLNAVFTTSTTTSTTSTSATGTTSSGNSLTSSSTTISTTSTTTATSSVGPISASTTSSWVWAWNTTSAGSAMSSSTTNGVGPISASTTTSDFWAWTTTSSSSSSTTTTPSNAVGPISYSVSTSIWTTVISDEYTITWDDWTTTTTTSSAIVDPTLTSSANWADWTTTTSSAIVDPTLTSSANWADWTPTTTSSVVVDPVSVSDVTTTIWVTSYIDVCPTGFTTRPYTLTTTVPVAPASATTTAFVWPTDAGGVPEGFTTAITTCTAGCAESWTVVTVTIPIATTTALITQTIVPVQSTGAFYGASSSSVSPASTATYTGAGFIVSAASSASVIVQAVQASSVAPASSSSSSSKASAAVETLSLSSIIVSPAQTSAAQSGWLGVAATTSSSSKSSSTSHAAVATYTGAAAQTLPGTAVSVAVCLAVGVVGLLF